MFKKFAIAKIGHWVWGRVTTTNALCGGYYSPPTREWSFPPTSNDYPICRFLANFNQFIRANSERSLIIVINVGNSVLELIVQLTGK
ncbi:hypothetical protein [Nostoc sp.]|uniref:hypothetical protein n=1 Tax=Nostoc sp. TaxID=1180 RepID=UPI002FF77B2F